MAGTFPFRAVIFDMDGVIVDTEAFYWRELRAFSDALGLGITDEELDRQVGQSHQAFQRSLVAWLARGGREGLSPAAAEAVFNDWSRGYPCDYAELLNPGVHETIGGLVDLGARVALASSSPLASIERVLGECGLSDAFEVIVSGEQFHESKPDPEIYLHTLDLLGLPAGSCCCVEDSVPGITAGKRAGLTVIAKREERFGFSQDAADAIVDGVPDVLDIGRLLAR